MFVFWVYRTVHVYIDNNDSIILPPKAKAVPLHATEALRGEEVYLLLILDLSSRWG
jgi:hypothetical protein